MAINACHYIDNSLSIKKIGIITRINKRIMCRFTTSLRAMIQNNVIDMSEITSSDILMSRTLVDLAIGSLY